MSQLQKLRAKTNKVKIAFTFEKTVNGIEIHVKSQKLGALIDTFINNDFGDPMTTPILRSLHYCNNYESNTIINGTVINLQFLKKPNKTLKINNVFTNDEIKAYIELFETYMLKIKMLVIGLNRVSLLNEVSN